MIKETSKLINSSLEKTLPDIVFKNAKIIDVFCLEIFEGDIAVSGDTIVGIGNYEKGKETIDLEGKFSDDKINNLVDDSLHVFYAAHCDYFITLDKKCKYKAIKVYNELGIKTEVYDPFEFIDIKID